jgi:hypothetical protein
MNTAPLLHACYNLADVYEISKDIYVTDLKTKLLYLFDWALICHHEQWLASTSIILENRIMKLWKKRIVVRNIGLNTYKWHD